jgi:hypothetical protein
MQANGRLKLDAHMQTWAAALKGSQWSLVPLED